MSKTGSGQGLHGPKLSLSIVKLGHPKAANRHNRVASSDDIFVIYDQVAKALSSSVEAADVPTTDMRHTHTHTHCILHATHTTYHQRLRQCVCVCASCQHSRTALRLSVSLSVIVFLMEGTPNIDRT